MRRNLLVAVASILLLIPVGLTLGVEAAIPDSSPAASPREEMIDLFPTGLGRELAAKGLAKRVEWGSLQALKVSISADVRDGTKYFVVVTARNQKYIAGVITMSLGMGTFVLEYNETNRGEEEALPAVRHFESLYVTGASDEAILEGWFGARRTALSPRVPLPRR